MLDKEMSYQDAMVVLIHMRDLLQSIDGKIDTRYLWEWIEKEVKNVDRINNQE